MQSVGVLYSGRVSERVHCSTHAAIPAVTSYRVVGGSARVSVFAYLLEEVEEVVRVFFLHSQDDFR